MRKFPDAISSFKAKIYISSLFIEGKPELGPCWLWNGSRRDEYGSFIWDGRTFTAHRWYYEHVHGPINQFLQLDHLCKRTLCVNDLHLEIVTAQENTLRSSSFAALNAIKTHCPNGHEYTESNTYIRRDRNGRGCRTCRSEAARLHRVRKAQ